MKNDTNNDENNNNDNDDQDITNNNDDKKYNIDNDNDGISPMPHYSILILVKYKTNRNIRYELPRMSP